ncbi:MAG: hypothetical protein ACTSU2_08045 [Promethearchaeota archaeon]
MSSTSKDIPIAENEKVEIHAMALIKIIGHCARFLKSDKKSPLYQMPSVYGFLIGAIGENNVRIIKDAEPILHHPTPDLEFDEKFMMDMDQFNMRYVEEESTDRIIGWYKSVSEPIRFRAIDVKNHLKFQTLNSNYIGLVINTKKFFEEHEYGFSIFKLLGDSFGDLNIMSQEAKIPWEILPLGDKKDATVRLMTELIDSVVMDTKFVTELDEFD